MKTVALNNRTAVRSFFVLAALAALAGLYFYRRQGGSFSSLAARGTDAIGAARNWVNKVAPSVADQAQSLAPKSARESVSKISSRSKSVAASAQI